MHTTSHNTHIGSGPSIGQLHQPWREWLLSIVTLGVYAAARHYRINRELSEFGVEVDPTRALLAFAPGGLVVVPLLITVYRTAGRIRVAQETAGLPPTIDPGLSAALALCSLAHTPGQQAALNEVWRAEGAAPT